MQAPERISLNAVRTFVVAADCGSLKLAASRLGVTPGAVSHQIRGLEAVMGVQLFLRANNSIRLTETGERLFRQGAAGVQTLENAIRAAMQATAEISVGVPVTLATRWLIPGLEDFRCRNPDKRIRIETTTGIGVRDTGDVDVRIAYHPVGSIPAHAEILLEDRCRPYLSPALLARIGDARDLEAIPALQSGGANWDWHLWLERCGKASARLTYAGHFDLDDAALRAAIAGLGMVLAPEFIVRDDLSAARLCPFPEAEEVLLGAYTIHRYGPARRQTETFVGWLREHGGYPGRSA